MLERESQLQQLAAAFARVASGQTGMCAVVSGEAGIGKTSLVQAFARSLPAATQVLQCGCEALFTPRPFGPWLDIATHLPPAVERALLRAPGAGSPFTELFQFFRGTRGARVLIVEDVHWADVGTLDLLHFLGRRLGELRLLLVLTHRDDALDSDHPLQRVLGHLPASTTARLPLPPLSAQAVHSLARAARRNGAELYAATG
ncbi:MAG TPA: AAA family ATPase, partial [Burkholderiaceae bacterium]|nr:AAA family ATPase [Burkholderiaceae bacterium]